jgi:transposase
MVMKKNYIEFEQVVERGCGMDVHKEIIVVTIQGKGIKTMTKSFHAFTSSLIKLKKWLKKTWYYPYCYGKYRGLLETCF